MRYVIIFGTTFLICMYLILFDPFAKYLGIYKDEMIIEYDKLEEGYHWECETNNILNVEELNNNKWKISKNKIGDAKLLFYYINDNDSSDIKYTINYEFDVKFNNIFWTVGEAIGLENFPNPY